MKKGGEKLAHIKGCVPGNRRGGPTGKLKKKIEKGQGGRVGLRGAMCPKGGKNQYSGGRKKLAQGKALPAIAGNRRSIYSRKEKKLFLERRKKRLRKEIPPQSDFLRRNRRDKKRN